MTTTTPRALTSAACRASLALAALFCGHAVPAGAEADPVEGVWDFTVTRRDCSSGAVLGTQKALSMFHRGGAFGNDNSMPPQTHGAMFGSWKRKAGAAAHYTVQMVFMRFNPDGTLAGTQRVQRELVLAADQRQLSGSVVAHSTDTAGAVLQRGCADETGVRVF